MKAATGPDKISAKLLKMVAPSVAPSLTSLFNHSTFSGQFPSEWKEANVTPIPKSGDKDLRWHSSLSAKVTKNANLGYSHDQALS